MTIFAGPDYASYRQLCRELWEPRVPGPGWYPHEFTFGDVFTDDRNPEPVWYGEEFTREDHEGATWYPRLDQWLAMLEEAGVEAVTIQLDWANPKDATEKEYAAFDASDIPDTDEKTSWPTREEAAARLWCAATGRVVTT